MASFGLEGKWAYRFPWESQWFGLPRIAAGGRRHRRPDHQRLGTLASPWEYREGTAFSRNRLRPGLHAGEARSRPGRFPEARRHAHDAHFTLRRDGARPTRPGHRPQLATDARPDRARRSGSTDARHRDVFTTVMNWTSYNQSPTRGVRSGRRTIEFERVPRAPALVAPAVLELAVDEGKTRHASDRAPGPPWLAVVHPPSRMPRHGVVSGTITETSKAEWGVAKNGYVRGTFGLVQRALRLLPGGRPPRRAPGHGVQ